MSCKDNKKTIENIIIVNDFDYVQGGASKVAIDTANLLVEKNNQLNVFFFSASHNESSTLDKRVISVCTEQGEALKDKNRIRGMINGLYNFKAKNEFKKLLNSLDKDKTLIHVHGWTKCLSSSVFDIAKKMDFKIVITMHDYFTACPNGGYFNYCTNKICKLNPMSLKCVICNCDSRNYLFKVYRLLRQKNYNNSLKKVKDVIAITDFSLNILKQTLPKDINIARINNPVQFDEDIEKIDYTKNDYYLYVGRVSKEKGVDLFCQAITELNLKGIVVGDGEQRKLLQEKYTNIEFTGWKTEAEVKEYMKKAKFLIFPTRWYETMGLIVLEALRFGIPSLVSKNCAASEISNKTNSTGDTFDCNVDSIKKCILEQKKFIVNREILKEYTLENYYNNIITLYQKILK